MNVNDDDNLRFPKPELLAAYADGELDAVEHRRLADWLIQHPEAAGDVAAQRQVARIWEVNRPSDPSRQQWDAVLNGIQRSIPCMRRRPPFWRRRVFGIGLALTGAAAALLAFTLVHPRKVAEFEFPDAAEILPVASADDVDILRLNAADRVSLVVGLPPVDGPLDVAGPDDVDLENVEPGDDGMLPNIGMNDKTDGAVIVAPLSPSPERVPGSLPPPENPPK